MEPGQEGDDETCPTSPDGVEPGVPVIQRAVITIGGQASEPEDEDDDVVKPLPDRLVTELTAERTLALRDKLATTPSVAFQAVLHKFCLDVFSRYSASGNAMEVAVRSVTFPIQSQGLKDTPTAKAISERHKSWEERLPKDRADLWDWLTTLTGDDQANAFERFWRAPTARELPGSGLGLAIVADTVEQHGGTVFFTDAPGGGSRVGFAIPGLTELSADPTDTHTAGT